MNALRALECPRCGAPTTFAAPFCAYCRATLVMSAPPELGSGTVLQSFDFTKGVMLPGVESYKNVQPTPWQGLRYAVGHDMPALVSYVTPQLRNGSASLRAVCMDPRGVFGLRVRVHRFAGANAGYALEVRPGHQSFRVCRFAAAGGKHHAEDIVTSRHHPSIMGPGGENEIELRFVDSVFNVLLNGVLAHTFVDARFGFGHAAVWVSRLGEEPADVVLKTFELRGAAPLRAGGERVPLSKTG